VSPFGVSWDGLTAADLILVNKDGKVVDGGASGLLLNAAGEILLRISKWGRILFVQHI
jgi:ribulose-5-phosphate 4-epimerase/fuculose-1-phosphate aldolase